jgi:hypothetical protein
VPGALGLGRGPISGWVFFIYTLCILIVSTHANPKIGLVYDFFTLQPVTDAAVFLLRVVLHDWPDAFAHRILLRLREAAAPHTKLVLADFVLPLACVDDFGVGEGGIDVQVEGAEKMLAPAPLLANLGKASANAYWMDLTVGSLRPVNKLEDLTDVFIARCK